MTTANLDAVNLADASEDGIIHEDVMNKIWDISKIPLPFTDMIGSSSHDNQYFSWTTDKLQSQDFDNAREDGEDLTGDDSKIGRRMGNHSQISTKIVQVSTRANAVNTIGFANTLAYQVTNRQQELRRDVEGIIQMNGASVEAADGVEPRSAGLMAWLVADTDIDGIATPAGSTFKNVFRAAGGADGGWDDTVTDKLVAISVLGTAAEALTETKVRDVQEAIYKKGGDPSYAMTTPAVKRLFSEYLFTSSARIASLIADGGGGASERKASGSVDVFLTDFGVLDLVPNRLMPHYDTTAIAAGGANDYMFILDTKLLSLSYLQGYRVEPQSKTGLSEKRQMSVDYSLCVKNWDGLGGVADIDPTAPVTFS